MTNIIYFLIYVLTFITVCDALWPFQSDNGKLHEVTPTKQRIDENTYGNIITYSTEDYNRGLGKYLTYPHSLIVIFHITKILLCIIPIATLQKYEESGGCYKDTMIEMGTRCEQVLTTDTIRRECMYKDFVKLIHFFLIVLIVI